MSRKKLQNNSASIKNDRCTVWCLPVLIFFLSSVREGDTLGWVGVRDAGLAANAERRQGCEAEVPVVYSACVLPIASVACCALGFNEAENVVGIGRGGGMSCMQGLRGSGKTRLGGVGIYICAIFRAL